MKLQEEILKNYLKTYLPDVKQDNLVEYLQTNYSFDCNLDDFTSSLINNYILIQSEIMRDIKEINNRIKEIELDKKIIIEKIMLIEN